MIEATSCGGVVIYRGKILALYKLSLIHIYAMKAVRKVTDVSPDDVEALLKAALKQL